MTAHIGPDGAYCDGELAIRFLKENPYVTLSLLLHAIDQLGGTLIYDMDVSMPYAIKIETKTEGETSRFVVTAGVVY